MDEARRFIAERTELGKIDYLLDQLARAVERGEVHRASYDMLAPRYLHRREELVAIITGRNRAMATGDAGPVPASPPVGTPPSVAAGPVSAGYAGPVSAGYAGPANGPVTASAGSVPRVAPSEGPRAAAVAPRGVERPASRPVAWTTVLLFLGAFLVVVASAIFAVAVWDLLGATGKLAFLGTVTVAFYAAGWWARTRLETPAGGTTLVAVASAMLLFDGWIAIDGYGLEGPLPWAALLLVCSAVYWFTEVRIAGRFFGVIGAAAQLGWWWLLGEGIGLPAAMRMAGMSLVALLWHVVSHREVRAPSLRSLASVLEVAAPVVQVGVSIGIVADLALVRSVGLPEIAAAGVVAMAAGWTIAHTRELEDFAYPFAAIAQVPLGISILVAIVSTGHSFAIAGILLVATLVYSVVGLLTTGVSFAVAALVAELALVLEVGYVLEWSSPTLIAAAAVLAGTWAIASALVGRLAESPGAPKGAVSFALATRVGALVVLGAASVLLLLDPLVMSASTLNAGDVAATAAVLGAWLVAAFTTRRGEYLVPAVVWSFVPLHQAGTLAWGTGSSALTYGLLVVAAGGWLAVSGLLGRVFRDRWSDAVRWTARLGILVFALVGCVTDTGASAPWGTLAAAGLAAVAAVLLALDAWLSRCQPSAAAAGWLAALGGALAAGSMPGRPAVQFALGGAGTAAAVGAIGAGLRPFARRYGGPAAIAGALLGTMTATAALGNEAMLTGALALVALAWTFSAVASGAPVAFIAGLSWLATFGSIAPWLDTPPIVTVALVGGPALLLVSYSVRRRDAEEPLPVLPLALAASGLLGMAALIALGMVAQIAQLRGQWWNITGHPFALAIALLGVSVLFLSWRYRVRAGHYVGWGVMLLALWAEFGALSLETAEFYSTSLAVYLIAMGHLACSMDPEGRYPGVLDAAAIVIGLGVPLRLSLIGYPPEEALLHAAWVIMLSLIAITGGVLGKVRWYFFGGVTALALVAFYRSFSTLVEVWWLVLFVIGVGLLVVALTWERQRVVVSATRDRLKRSFEQWR